MYIWYIRNMKANVTKNLRNAFQRLIVLLLLLSMKSTAIIGQNLAFQKLYCITEFKIYDFLITPSGSIFIATYDTSNYSIKKSSAVLRKFDKNFNMIWEKKYGGSDEEYFNLVQYIGDSRILVRGQSRSLDGDVLNNNTYGSNEWICVMDTNGNILHQLIYSGAYSTTKSDNIKIGPNGDFYFCGDAEGNAYDFVGNGPYDFSFDGYIACADSQLNKKWLHFFEVTPGDSWVYDFDFLPNGHMLLLAGSNLNNGAFAVNAPTDKGASVIMEVDTLGNIYWQKRYGQAVNRGGFLISIYKDPNKWDYYLAGVAEEKDGDCWDSYPYLAEAGSNYHWVMKIDTLGNKIWSHIYGPFCDTSTASIEGYFGVFDNNVLHFSDGVVGSDILYFFVQIGKKDCLLIDVDSNGVLSKHLRIGYPNVRWQPMLARQNPLTKEIYYLYFEAKAANDFASPNICDSTINKLNYIIGKYNYWPNTVIDANKEKMILQVYPNPAKGALYIEQLTKGTWIEIYSIEGKKMTALRAEKSKEKISVHGWPRGTYIVKAQYKKQVVSQKIILQ